MIRLNNRGQTLVMFVVIMPIILFALILAIDLGQAYSVKQELNNVNSLAIDYGLDILDSLDATNKIREYVNLNVKDVSNLDVRIVDDEVFISITKYSSGIISHAINIESYEINSTYVGRIQDNRKIIKKVK